ncbi:hypothetical protein BCR42DRAFT_429452 [Absidia repens]|uniref:Transmembrane protein n=1 Tax=Absidia repens TaxID=90262 RepID=A0A1X2HWR3_9FUNG|nr:hypothetical protein BCR42DRAFT_429452 [Absidia repens]
MLVRVNTVLFIVIVIIIIIVITIIVAIVVVDLFVMMIKHNDGWIFYVEIRKIIDLTRKGGCRR